MKNAEKFKNLLLLLGTYLLVSLVFTYPTLNNFYKRNLLIEDKNTIYRLREGYKGGLDYQWNDVPGSQVCIDSSGFRVNQDNCMTKNDQDRVTIFTIGDSNTFGWGVPDNQTYSAQLERLLEKEFPGVYRVVNAGMPGCSSFQAKQRVTDFVKRFHIDIVILFLGGNDGRPCYISDKDTQSILKYKPYFLNYFAPFMLLHYRSLQDFAKWSRFPTIDRVPSSELSSYVDEIMAITKKHGIKSIILNRAGKPERKKILEAAAKKSNSPYIDGIPLLWAASNPDLIFKLHGHPTVEGHALIAEKLFKIISDRHTFYSDSSRIISPVQ